MVLFQILQRMKDPLKPTMKKINMKEITIMNFLRSRRQIISSNNLKTRNNSLACKKLSNPNLTGWFL